MSMNFKQHLKQRATTAISLATIPGAIAKLAVGIAFFSAPAMVNALEIGDLSLDSIQQLRQVITQNNEPPEVILGQPDSVPAPQSTTRSADTRFTCELVNGEYTVMYYPESQPDEGYPWAIPSELGGGWTPERRCDAITSRFETYREDGLLELTTGEENGYDTICVTTQLDPTDCRIVLTVPPGQDPQLTRDLIFDNLLVADDGGSTQGVYTFGDSQGSRDIIGEIGNVINGGSLGNGGSTPRQSSPESINLKPFLDPADGGTGQNFRNTSAAPASSSTERKPAIFK
ncbi:MAG: COP23 domain-containing protein [Cyanobacteria bacterium J06631_2]